MVPSQGDVSPGQRHDTLVAELASGHHVTLDATYVEESPASATP